MANYRHGPPADHHPLVGLADVLFNNLVQMGQVQISDIVPLDQSAMETVAVLLVVSGTSNEVSTGNDIALREEAEPGAWSAIEPAIGEPSDLSTGGSNLERFLSDLDGAFRSVSRDILAATGEPTGVCSESVWQPPDVGLVAVTGAGVARGGSRIRVPVLEPGLEPRTTLGHELGADNTLAAIIGLDGESLQTEAEAGFSGWAVPLGGMLVISSLFFAGSSAWNRRRSGASRRIDQPMPTSRPPHMPNRPTVSRSLGSRAAHNQDLPPWLADRRPALSGR